MSDADSHVYVYEIGEAYDDLRPAFFIDMRAYSDVGLAQSVIDAADAALAGTGVIYGVKVTAGRRIRVPADVPTWEEFRRRHFVEGEPLPVRPLPSAFDVPPGWDDMHAAVAATHDAVLDELHRIAGGAWPGRRTDVTDRGPLRRSTGSVTWSEERYGFEIWLDADTSELRPADSLEALAQQLSQAGWLVEGSPPDILTATREHFDIWAQARPSKTTVRVRSPLYRAPAGPGAPYAVEPRQR